MPSPTEVKKTLKDVVTTVKAAVEKVKKYLDKIPEGEEKSSLIGALDSLSWAVNALEKALSLPNGGTDIQFDHIQGFLDTANMTIGNAKLLTDDNLAKIGLNGAQTTIAMQAIRVARVGS